MAYASTSRTTRPGGTGEGLCSPVFFMPTGGSKPPPVPPRRPRSGNERDAVLPLERFGQVSDQREVFDQVGQTGGGPHKEYTGRMPSRREMVLQVIRQRVLVFGDQDSAGRFRPQQNQRVICAERKLRQVSDTHRIQRQLASQIVTLDRANDSSRQVLVQQEGYTARGPK